MKRASALTSRSCGGARSAGVCSGVVFAFCQVTHKRGNGLRPDPGRSASRGRTHLGVLIFFERGSTGGEKMNGDKMATEKMSGEKMATEKMSGDKMSTGKTGTK